MNNAATPSLQAGVLTPNSETRLRLFCFPYAGAGASVFREWANGFPAEIEVIPVQLPGRESRIREAPLRRVEALVEILIGDFANMDLPFAFFGHSMGALVSYELARKLRGDGKRAPVHLFVSARRAPSIPDDREPLHKLGDTELLEKLREFRGTPEEMFRYPELISFWLQILRADLESCEMYVYTDAAPLDCPISAFGGLEDPHVSREELLAWRDETTGSFRLHMFPGDHFFLHRCREMLLRVIAGDLSVATSDGRLFEGVRGMAS